jgi:hypothetical protein
MRRRGAASLPLTVAAGAGRGANAKGFNPVGRWRHRNKAPRLSPPIETAGRVDLKKAALSPRVDAELRDLIRRMCRENPLWGAPRIHGELLKLGFTVAQSTVSKYMVRGQRPPSQGWKTVLRSHADHIAAVDFLVVPTLSFERLFAFVVLGLGRRGAAPSSGSPSATHSCRDGSGRRKPDRQGLASWPTLVCSTARHRPWLRTTPPFADQAILRGCTGRTTPDRLSALCLPTAQACDCRPGRSPPRS